MTWSNINVDAIGLAAEVVDLRRELEQQATLLGKGSEREARLLAENAELRAENAALREDIKEEKIHRSLDGWNEAAIINDLKRENAALKNALDHQMSKRLLIAFGEINDLKVKAEFYEREIARLRADGVRLDFMLSPRAICMFSAACLKLNINSTGEQWLQDARRAIDAAMKEGK